ncbi:MAG: insulinase family protein [Pirellulales bacterium]|nr:insulinase family protein [Pirellulales bacterium]
MVLVAEPMPWLDSAAFTLLVPAGCVHEPADCGGLTSFTCEMALRGAGPRDSRRFIEDLDNLGVEWSDSVSTARTGFSGATVAGNLPTALEIFADVVQRPHLPEDQLEAARLVMFQELRAVEDEPAQKVMIEAQRHYYPDPWGRPSQGNEEAIEAIGIEPIRRHFGLHYRPNGAILGVAGRLDWPELKDTVERLLGGWDSRQAPGVVDGVAGKKVEHLEQETKQTHIAVAYDTVPYRDPDYFQAWGAVGVLGSGMSSRLFTEVRERRGLCYHVDASYHSLLDRAGVFCYAGTSAERAQETLDVMLAVLSDLGRGIEAAELDRLKARIKSGLIMQQESSTARSSMIASDWYHLGRVRTLDEVSRIVDGLTPESINAYLARRPPRDYTIVTLGPRPLEVNIGVR